MYVLNLNTAIHLILVTKKQLAIYYRISYYSRVTY